MERIKLSPFQVARETLEVMLKTGLLMVTVDEKGKPNAMTIGWGFIGYIWTKPVFIVAVRPSRYTYTLVEKTGDFTVNVPVKGMEKAVELCGTVSGRDVDKFKECNFTPIASKYVKAPIIGECAIGFECRAMYKQDLISEALTKEVVSLCYPKGDYHRLYFGEILRVTAYRNYRELIL